MRNTIKEKKKGKVAIMSRESDTKSKDIIMLEEELLKRGLEVRTLTKLLTKDKGKEEYLSYAGHMMSQAAAMVWADVVVVDTYIVPVCMLPHTGLTKVIQMWHALGAVKKFGWQTVGSDDGSPEKTAKLMRMHKGYDYVIAPSDATAAFFAEAFRTDPGKIVKLGLPRADYILDVTRGDGRYKAMGAVYALYPHLASSDKTVVLYVPTFRRGSQPDVKGLADALDPEKYELIVRLHPLYKAEGELPQAKHVIYEENIPTYDLLACADAVISDYSSLVVEATIADKPIYLYTYDIDSYSKSTGLNMDFTREAIADYVFTDAEALAAAMDKTYDMEALKAFRDKYIEVEPGHCTEQQADFIQSQIR